MADINTIGIIAYPGCGEQDTLVPWEMLKSLAWVLSSGERFLDVRLLAMASGNVRMQMGLQVVPEGVVDVDNDLFDVLYVPGGMGTEQAALDQQLRKLVNRHAEKKRWIATNCSGLAILHRAGFLGDTQVTCAGTISRKVANEGGNVAEPRLCWLGDEEAKVWTAAGGSAAHPSTTALVAHLFGQELGRVIGMMWDTLPMHGKVLFQPIGPEFLNFPFYSRELQDQWEDQLLPDEPAAQGEQG